ncbi:MAG: asparagine synthase (glutamine-hydrolyzing), partial [Lentisphaeraceae bacterium]|nr:asparagine synthase (glutamine-hydrolyzing) [Lentisphaeraceae bacterium]
MCGISGLVNKKLQHVSESSISRIRASLQLMKTRGPNSQASCQGTNWILGHTRLSIIDLEGGSQPMQDRTTGVSLSYNGELYNHVHLRKQLQQLGHSFLTLCDTEVLLRSYIEWGQDCLPKLEGCFAFAVIDPRTDILFIGRDRLGVKPLYYYRDDESISFASSVAALKKICGKQQVDLAAVSHYFTTCRITFGEKTLYKNIYTLMPGTWKSFSLNSSKTRENKYWHRPALAEDEKKEITEEELLHNTRTMVNAAVSKRLMSDVPLGCFLSGGLDSAVVVDIAQNNSSERLPLYCAGTPFEKYNEFRYAAEVAQRLDSSVDEVTISPETFMDDWRRLIQLKGLPLSTPNETSIYRLAKALSSQCKVVLTGEASDEIFGGYVGPHFGIHDYLRAPHSDSPDNLKHPLYWKMMQRYGRSFFYNEV